MATSSARRAAHRLAAGRRHERPRAARHHGRSGGPVNGYPRQDSFDIVVASEVMAILCLATASRPQEAAGQHRRRLHPRLQTDPRARLAAHGAMTVAAEGGAQAQPGTDAGEQSGLRPRRPVRQHRARLQFGARDAYRAQARRLRGHRGRLRRRPGRREIHRHQVPQSRAAAGGGRDRRHTAGTQVPRRQPAASDVNKENLAALEKGLANLERHVDNVRNHYGLPCVVAINHFSCDTEAEIGLLKSKMAHHGAPVVSGAPLGPGRRGRRPSWRRRWSTCRQARIDHDVRLRGVAAAVGEDEGHRDQDLWRRRHQRRSQGARTDQAAAGCGLRPLPGVRREDPVLVLDRSEPRWAHRPVTR